MAVFHNFSHNIQVAVSLELYLILTFLHNISGLIKNLRTPFGASFMYPNTPAVELSELKSANWIGRHGMETLSTVLVFCHLPDSPVYQF